jgi:glycosyltransferase involved in cell wall biosynthesis
MFSMAADWIVTLVGSREHYAVPRAFLRRGRLLRLYTDAWCGFGRGLLRRGPASWRAMAGRYHPEIPPQRVTAFTPKALMDRVGQPRNRSVEAEHLEYLRIGKQFCEAVNRDLARRKFSADELRFYGYDTACLETMQMLRERGVFCVVDQIDPGRVEEEMVLEEVQRWPGWEKVEGRKPEVYWKRLHEEWKLADAVVVNSQWSKDALVKQGVAAEKVVVIPLAYEDSTNAALERKSGGPLHVLWLGSVILRKGIQYLVEAAKLLLGSDVLITVAGPIAISQEAVKSAPANMKFIGRVTRDEAAGMYREADLFVLPTISDGFAITQLEAMSHGLPVIATPNCGRVVTDELDGRIVPTRDAKALAEAILWFANDRRKLRAASEAAKAKSREFSVHHLSGWLEQLDVLAEGRRGARSAV